MSFKREGDDHGLLMTLQRRRISELLANHIPEDEAILLKNGRYSCSICLHRPIFDTLAVLSVHRKSKKHLHNLTLHLQKKEELRTMISKKQQDHYIKTNASPRQLKDIGKEFSQQSCKTLGLLKQPHYSSCSKNMKRKKDLFDRKCRIFLSDNKQDNVTKESPKETSSKTSSSIVRSYLKGLQRKKDFGSLVDKARRNSSSTNNIKHVTTDAEQIKSEKVNTKNQSTNNESDLPLTLEKSEEQQKRTDYYLNLRAKGWKKDIHGNWMKDEDAEFDSDEDLPLEYPL